MMDKESLMNFDWISPSKTNGASNNFDVVITKRSKGFAIHFKNHSADKLGDKVSSDNFDRVEFAFVNKDVVAFRKNKKGYALCRDNGDGSVEMVFQERKSCPADIKITTQMIPFIGGYDLRYDKTFNLYYIDRNNRKEC